MIYLDYAATTPMCKKALEEYNRYASQDFFNPSARYYPAIKVTKEIEETRNLILKTLGAKEGAKIIFTSSATESNNLAIFGAFRKNFKKFVFSEAEHSSVKNVALELKERGCKVEFVPLQQNGEIDYNILEDILDEETDFISIMHICNETGAINDLKRISEIKNRKSPNAIFHSDGVQAFSKVKINLAYYNVDLYTISAHKMFGPKGVSALYVSPKVNLKPIIFGGGQENNVRSGTENVPAILAFKQAILDIGDIKRNYLYVESLKKEFINNLDCYYKLNSNENCSPYIISLSFRGVKGETLLHALEEKGVLLSTGSACSSKKSGNLVLASMGIENELIIGSLRISFSKISTLEDAKMGAQLISECYKELYEKLR